MGDRATLAKARKELEEMYVGVPDDSVNLSFQDLAAVMQQNAEKKKAASPSSTMEAVAESGPTASSPSPLAKLPSLDFNRGLEASLQSSTNNDNHQNRHGTSLHLHHHWPEQGDSRGPQCHMHGYDHHHHHHRHHDVNVHSHHNHHHHGTGFRHTPTADQRSFAYDDMSYVSGMSLAYGQERGGRRWSRPGIPHSNICTICSNYIYIFRHRCLVCGRVYCRHCVSIGMGEMTEGRKCIECLGRRFSQKYIHKAGNVGCCMGYPSTVKQQELKWAEKGPRRSGENINGGRSMVAPTSRSPTPTRQHSPSNPPSFVISSPYSQTNHHSLPL